MCQTPPPTHPPGLLRYIRYAQVRYFQVSEAELVVARAGFECGLYDIKIEPSTFDVAAYTAMEASVQEQVAAFKVRGGPALTLPYARTFQGCGSAMYTFRRAYPVPESVRACVCMSQRTHASPCWASLPLRVAAAPLAGTGH